MGPNAFTCEAQPPNSPDEAGLVIIHDSGEKTGTNGWSNKPKVKGKTQDLYPGNLAPEPTSLTTIHPTPKYPPHRPYPGPLPLKEAGPG